MEEKKSKLTEKNYKINQKTRLKWQQIHISQKIIVNGNGQKDLIKRVMVVDWIKKYPSKCYLQDTQVRVNLTHRLKVREEKKIFHAKRNDKKAELVILIPNKLYFNTKVITKDKEGHYIMINE